MVVVVVLVLVLVLVLVTLRQAQQNAVHGAAAEKSR